MYNEWVLYSFLGAGLSAAAYAAAALLHEGGHALVGCLFKAKCLWVRVGCILWVPGGGIFIGRWCGMRPGECALLCPDKKSCVAAAFGGFTVNLVTGAGVGFVWLFRGYFLWVVHPLLFVGMVSFSLCSLAMALLNFCPGMAGTKNDGAIAKSLCQDEEFCKRMRRNQQRDMVRLEFGILEEMF